MRIHDTTVDCSPALDFLRTHNLIIQSSRGAILSPRHHTTPISEFHMALAAQVQLEFEQACVALARALRASTGLDSLVLGGGSFLNAVANSRIAEESGFRGVHIFPAATDDGTSVGVAYSLLEQRCRRASQNAPIKPLKSVSLGRMYTDEQVIRALDALHLSYVRLPSMEALTQHAAAQLANGKIVGWFHGRSEFGPRALGNRSILASPLVQDIKYQLNGRIKCREQFRPFAPAVPEECASRYFAKLLSSPFMLFVYPVRPEFREILTEVTANDGEARVQTVAQADNELFHCLLIEFGKLTGIPILLNTSFNTNSEPIVESPYDAARCFIASGLDGLYIGNIYVQQECMSDRVPHRHDLTVRALIDMPMPLPATPISQLFVRMAGRPSGEYLISAVEFELLQQVDGTKCLGDISALLERLPDEINTAARHLARMGF